MRAVVFVWISELRRRWILASFAFLMVAVPVAGYVVSAVPRYRAQGVLQVSSHSGALNPLAELTGDGQPHVQTEVEIIRRREFVAAVLHDLRLNVVDPTQPSFVSSNLDVTLHGASPVRPALRRIREALSDVATTDAVFNKISVSIEGIDAEVLDVSVGGANTYTYTIGDVLEDPSVRLAFSSMPVDVGEAFTFHVISSGPLVADAMTRLSVDPIGDSRRPTNLVEIAFRDPDRGIAQAVVRRIMQRYLDQSLEWQTLSASSTSEFVMKRLDEAKERLRTHEEALREFAETEHAVQLDVQAQTTIQASADLEAEKTKVELQQRMIGTALAGMRRSHNRDNVNITGFFDDPVLSANIAALSTSETQYAVLRATLTEAHPQVLMVAAQVAQQRKEVARLLRSARSSLGARRSELQSKLDAGVASLDAYPDKEIQLARRTRDVEVSQRLYSFLLEKYQEAEILEASTTTDKRVVDVASLPHRMATPSRGKLVVGGGLGAFAFAFASVWLARLLQRRLTTVESITQEVNYPIFGSIPAIAGTRPSRGTTADRLSPFEIWKDTHAVGPEAFRALAVNVSLAPAVPGRARIVQTTSSQPGEGKSTVVANLALALAKGGAKVLVVDLDLRKPVQHRVWKLRRAPGYSDMVAQSGGPDRAAELVHDVNSLDDIALKVITAGTRLPDTLHALMNDALESLLTHFSARYDYILLDGPPAFVADATAVGRVVDLLLVVARPGVVERGNLRHTHETLARLNVQTGFVMNGVERKHAEYYYGGSYAYGATYGGSTDESVDDEPRQAAS